ncbi:hypothetical protein MRX96_030017 [Rhipicephalus microplus]
MDVMETVQWTCRNLVEGCIAILYGLLQVNEYLGHIIIGVCVSATRWLHCLDNCLCCAYVELTYRSQDIAFFVCCIQEQENCPLCRQVIYEAITVYV